MGILNILYVSTLCSDEAFLRLFDASEIKPQQQAQKFHSLLAKGLAGSGALVRALSRAPIDNLGSNRVALCDEVDRHKVRYCYLKPSHYGPLRHLLLFFQAFLRTLQWRFSGGEERKVVVCDVLNFSISVGALFAARLLGVKSVAVVTDLPSFLNFTRSERGWSRFRRQVYQTLSDLVIGRYDFYMVLTEDINRKVNRRGRPYVVIEGMVDCEMVSSINAVDGKHPERVVIYAGALYEKFGVGKLVSAFSRVRGDDLRLWLYGAGDMEPEIRRASEIDSRIRYCGIAPNAEVVNEQLKATLLVNPRPSDEEFTKYSFPSKNMEYMVSGTPLLTTPLPGMPKEYLPFVFLFEDESVEGMAVALSRVLELSRSELHEKGTKSKNFVLERKNNKTQASVLISMLQSS